MTFTPTHLQALLHYFLHLIFPALIAFIFFKKDWKKVYILFLLTMLIDIDHLLASPIFDPKRCSVGFHPLHSFYAIPIYILLLFVPKKEIRIIAIGILFHIFTDTADCMWSFSNCHECFMNSKIHELFTFG